jgi:hypothetical protein
MQKLYPHQTWQEYFIFNATKKHNNTYNYSLVSYIKANIKVTIICPIHGPFMQRPNDHLRGNGCPCCKFEKIATLKRSNVESFISKAQSIHGNEYDYSGVVYKNAITKVVIRCRHHGTFFQTPDKHIGSSMGCPKCSFTTSHGEKTIQRIFDTNKIYYEREKRFDDLIGTTPNSRLRYDFWLPQFNTLIEFDGEHHFSSIRIKGKLSEEQSKIAHHKTVHNDLIKNEYAKINGYKLIRIHWSELSKLKFTYFQSALGLLPRELGV